MNESSRKESAAGARGGVTITREFDFPRETVFRMLTDAKKAAKVWGPEGSVKLAFELDPRPGGSILIRDQYDGKTAETTGTILEFVAPERLVFRSVTTPLGSTAPWEAVQSVRCEALGPHRTRVTVHVKVLVTGSFPGGVESLEQGFQGGWGQTFDMLRRELG